MSRSTKNILIAAGIFLAYGYLCRILKIYFFWESKSLGWMGLIIALLSYWIDLRRKRKQLGKNTGWVIAGICTLIFALVLLPVIGLLLKTSDAYKAATEYLKTDNKIKNEMGKIKGYGLFPTGAVQTSTINGAVSGEAQFEIIVKGEKKYKDITIYLRKSPDTFWKVTLIE